MTNCCYNAGHEFERSEDKNDDSISVFSFYGYSNNA